MTRATAWLTAGAALLLIPAAYWLNDLLIVSLAALIPLLQVRLRPSGEQGKWFAVSHEQPRLIRAATALAVVVLSAIPFLILFLCAHFN